MNPFPGTAATLGLFDFTQRTLADFSGYNHDLQGTHSFRECDPGVFELAPGSDVFRPIRDALLAMTGEMTVEVTGRMYAAAGLTTMVAFIATGETLATNVQWLLGTQDANRLRWLQEFGAGTDSPSAPLAGVANESLPAPGCDFHAAGTRYADGSVALFLNGRLQVHSPPLTAPAGGTSAVLRVMSGSTAFGLRGIRIQSVSMTAFEIADSYEQVMGSPPAYRALLWVGATTHETATVVVRTDTPVASLELTLDDGVNAPWQTSALATDADRVARFDLTGLAADTRYTYALPNGQSGEFRTHPAAAGTACSFTIAFAGDAETGSRHPVFDEIRRLDPLMYAIIGDAHYRNNATNSPPLFHDALDEVLSQPPQARLLRSVATAYVWDDHDYGGNNSNASSASKPAACAVFRSRVPHYGLPHATAIYEHWDVGRVRFIKTDQRSEAVAGSILGPTQLAWFKSLLANSPGMAIVWICPRWFCHANHADSWNSYADERTGIADWVKANCPGRVQVWEADQHTGAIHNAADYATGGGEPLRCFRAAPLDKNPTSALANTYSHGEYNGNGQFGLVRVTDTGGATVDFEWELRNSAGATLTSYTFSVAV